MMVLLITLPQLCQRRLLTYHLIMININWTFRQSKVVFYINSNSGRIFIFLNSKFDYEAPPSSTFVLSQETTATCYQSQLKIKNFNLPFMIS